MDRKNYAIKNAADEWQREMQNFMEKLLKRVVCDSMRDSNVNECNLLLVKFR